MEGKVCPPQKKKTKEKFSDATKNRSTAALLLRLCESIFHIEMVVILDSGFYVSRAIIKLKKRGVFTLTFI